MLSDDFGDMLNQLIFIQPKAGSGPYGATYGEGRNYPCYIERTIKAIKDKSGKDTVSSLQIYLDPAVISDQDKLTLGSANPVILRIDKNVDENGDDYSLVVFT